MTMEIFYYGAVLPLAATLCILAVIEIRSHF
mgnify:CR=1 FL=1